MKNTELPSLIKDLRTTKGWSQEDLSENSGLSLRTIQRLENGDSVPRGDTLQRLTNALEIPSDFFTRKISEEKYNSEFKTSKKIIIPLYIIGFTLIGGSVGFILGLILTLLQVIPKNEIGGLFTISFTVLFSATGLIVGNVIEKKHKNSIP